jgi:hypothetical protein
MPKYVIEREVPGVRVNSISEVKSISDPTHLGIAGSRLLNTRELRG